MTDWQGIAELLGVSAVLMGAITGARSLVMLLLPEKKFKSRGIRQKQALIVDSANSHEWANVLSICTIVGAGFAVFVKVVTKIPMAFADAWAMGFALLAPLAVAAQGTLLVLEAHASRKMGKALEKKGFEVSIIHKASVKWDKLLDRLARGAGDATISWVHVSSHGDMISKKSIEFDELQKKDSRNLALYENRFVPGADDRKKFSVLSNGNIPDYALVGMLPRNGKNVLTVDSCHAGGMAETAKMLTGMERENIAVMTSTHNNAVQWNNPQARNILRYIRRDSGSVPVSEFFEKHCREQAGWRRFKQPFYRPMQFSGKNMKITL